MTQPTVVLPTILSRFAEPRSGTQVAKENNWDKNLVWNHIRLARRKGLIALAGTRKDRLTSCTHKLYELTPAGVDYLEVKR